MIHGKASRVMLELRHFGNTNCVIWGTHVTFKNKTTIQTNKQTNKQTKTYFKDNKINVNILLKATILKALLMPQPFWLGCCELKLRVPMTGFEFDTSARMHEAIALLPKFHFFTK